MHVIVPSKGSWIVIPWLLMPTAFCNLQSSCMCIHHLVYQGTVHTFAARTQ